MLLDSVDSIHHIAFTMKVGHFFNTLYEATFRKMNYWLFKSEPDAFSIDDLTSRPEQTEPWDGVRNYQARNIMRDMHIGDRAFFYHSNAGKQTGIVGIIRVVSAAYPDPTQFDPDSKYYDPKSDPDNPRWDLVDVKFEEKFSEVITLTRLKTLEEIATCKLVQKGNRLSVMPIEKAHWAAILASR